MTREETIRKVLDTVLWTGNASDDNKRILTNALIKALEQEPTDKENLVVEDCISRQAVLDIAKSSKSNWIDNSVLFKKVNALPPVTPKPKTIQEKQAESEKYQKAFDDGYANGYAQARFDYESKTGHWIEHPHEAGANWEYPKYECSECHVWKDDDSVFCPDCGAKMLPTDQNCDSCKYQNEVDGSNCYECVKGIRNNYKADSEKEFLPQYEGKWVAESEVNK